MGKIDEFEQRVVTQGMTDEDFIEYEKLLKRVRGNFLKRQHCYTTDSQLPCENFEQAIKLIEYGLENFADEWFSTYKSYLHMGYIYERTRNYQKSYESYLLAKDVLEADHPEYVQELSISLFWVKLHIDSFCYSPEIEAYYECYSKTNEFSKSFINSEFRLAVANVVISLHHENTDEARKALEIARKICEPNYIGKLYSILKRNNYQESLNATTESIEFIKKLKI